MTYEPTDGQEPTFPTRRVLVSAAIGLFSVLTAVALALLS